MIFKLIWEIKKRGENKKKFQQLKKWNGKNIKSFLQTQKKAVKDCKSS